MTRLISYTMFILGLAFFIASFFTGAKAEPMCERKIPPYAVSKETYCRIATLAGTGGIECGYVKPERRP